MKRIGVAGIITGQSEKHFYHILMGRRGKDPNRGLFVLPGGGVEDNETLEEAFAREVLEETGLEIEPVQGYSRWEIPSVIELPDRIILVSRATVKSDLSLKDGSDLYDVQWFDFFDLPKDMSPVVIPVLNSRGFHVKKTW